MWIECIKKKKKKNYCDLGLESRVVTMGVGHGCQTQVNMSQACLPDSSNVGATWLPDPRSMDLVPAKSIEHGRGGKPSLK